MVVFEMDAPRYFYSQFDTYNVGIQQLGSESTMHDNSHMDVTALVEFKKKLPEGTYQKRIYSVNYQTLRRIKVQRLGHKLPEWNVFIDWTRTLPFQELLDVYVEGVFRELIDR